MNCTKSKILDDLKCIIHENFKIETDFIEMNTPIINGGISLGSIQMIELIVGIENFYSLQFNDDVLLEENFKDFDVLTNIISEIIQR